MNISAGNTLGAKKGGSIKIATGGGDTIFEFTSDGEIIFDEKDTDTIVKTFWDVMSRPEFQPLKKITLTAGKNADGSGGASISFHVTGDVTGDKCSPEPRAMKLLNKISGARPKSA